MKLVMLDRDGVINEDSGHYIKSAEEWVPIPGSLESVARLNQAGYRVAIVTNQSGIARGLFGVETLHAMHEKMNHLLQRHGGHIDVVAFCPHGPAAGCPCRKPAPGMLLQIADRLGIDLREVPLVGDTGADVQAATRAGAVPILVRTGKGEKTLQQPDIPLVPVYDDLADYVSHLLDLP